MDREKPGKSGMMSFAVSARGFSADGERQIIAA
jgi:hypothetical protein